MFEAYINGLRLLRRRLLDLDPSVFRHRRTVRDPTNLSGVSGGWSSWTTGAGSGVVALAWPWFIIQRGALALEPMGIQSNLLLLDAADQPLSETQTMAALLALVNRLDWHPHAEWACTVVPK